MLEGKRDGIKFKYVHQGKSHFKMLAREVDIWETNDGKGVDHEGVSEKSIQAMLPSIVQAQGMVMLCLFKNSKENGAGAYPIFF